MGALRLRQFSMASSPSGTPRKLAANPSLCPLQTRPSVDVDFQASSLEGAQIPDIVLAPPGRYQLHIGLIPSALTVTRKDVSYKQIPHQISLATSTLCYTTAAGEVRTIKRSHRMRPAFKSGLTCTKASGCDSA
ncbi:hypothetical protein FRC03_003876 [Tulasnella sp. 419]|nr:hypothetical protein FRC03_003876 [Tulasnella sp. 419]